MLNEIALIAKLRSCDRALDGGCYTCPFRYEEQVEQFLYRIRCAAEDAADELERLKR